MKLIDKSAVLAIIEKELSYYKDLEDREIISDCGIACYRVVKMLKSDIESLEVKEVDLELITGWFDHIAQIADDRMTLTNQRMTDAHALDEIKCLAKNSSEFITKHYKVQKGE